MEVRYFVYCQTASPLSALLRYCIELAHRGTDTFCQHRLDRQLHTIEYFIQRGELGLFHGREQVVRTTGPDLAAVGGRRFAYPDPDADPIFCPEHSGDGLHTVMPVGAAPFANADGA